MRCAVLLVLGVGLIFLGHFMFDEPIMKSFPNGGEYLKGAGAGLTGTVCLLAAFPPAKRRQAASSD